MLKEPIDWDRLPDDRPPSCALCSSAASSAIRNLRLRDIGEARIHLQDPKGSGALLSSISHAPAAPSMAPVPARRAWLPWSLLGVALLAILGLVFGVGLDGRGGANAPSSVIRSSLEAPPGMGFHLSGANPAAVAISPDGTRVVFGARDENGMNQLWLQQLSDPDPVSIPSTDGAQYPFWSPDSRAVAYFANGELRVVDLENHTDRPVTKASDGKGGAWLPDDIILFTESATAPISRVDIATGEVTRVTDLNDEPRANSHRLPRVLPDGRHFLFAARTDGSSPEDPVSIMVGDLGGAPSRELLTLQSHAEYADGKLLYLVDNGLYARPFDLESMEFTGQPTQVATEVGSIPGAALGLFSASDNGILVYHTGYRESMDASLAWYNLEGTREGELGTAIGFGQFDISPDGRRVVFAAYDNRTGLGDLWLHDIESDVRTRLSFESSDESGPCWSPDGKTIYYAWTAGNEGSIRALEPDGREEPRVVFEGGSVQSISSVSPDGRYLAYTASDTVANVLRAMVVPVDASAPPELVDADTPQSIIPRFSPDGRWIAYASLESGQWNLYLKAFPLTGRKWQLTDRTALWYDWDPSGDRIYYQWSGSELFATDLELSGSNPRIGKTELLFNDFPSPLTSLHQFQMAPDGQRFLVSDAGGSEDNRPIRLVVGWPSLLQEGEGGR